MQVDHAAGKWLRKTSLRTCIQPARMTHLLVILENLSQVGVVLLLVRPLRE